MDWLADPPLELEESEPENTTPVELAARLLSRLRAWERLPIPQLTSALREEGELYILSYARLVGMYCGNFTRLDKLAASLSLPFCQLAHSCGLFELSARFLVTANQMVRAASELNKDSPHIAGDPNHDRDFLRWVKVQLGMSLRKMGRTADADVLFDEVVAETPSADRLDEYAFTALSLRGLSLSYVPGQFEKGIEYIQLALSGYERLRGPTSPEVLSITNYLALAYHHNRQLDDAKRLYEQVYSTLRRQHGDDAPETLHMLSCLGAVQLDMGQLDEARRHLQRAINRQRAVLGPEHADTVATALHLANLEKLEHMPRRPDGTPAALTLPAPADGVPEPVARAQRVDPAGDTAPAPLSTPPAAPATDPIAAEAAGGLPGASSSRTAASTRAPAALLVAEARRRALQAGEVVPETLSLMMLAGLKLPPAYAREVLEKCLAMAEAQPRRLYRTFAREVQLGLAGMLLQLGEYSTAQRLLERRRDDCADALGEAHVETRLATQQLLWVLRSLRMFDAANELMDRTLQARRAADAAAGTAPAREAADAAAGTEAATATAGVVPVASAGGAVDREAAMSAVLSHMEAILQATPDRGDAEGPHELRLNNIGFEFVYFCLDALAGDMPGPVAPAQPACAGCGTASGKLQQCAGCHAVLYCTEACQRRHWPTHKAACKAARKKKAK